MNLFISSRLADFSEAHVQHRCAQSPKVSKRSCTSKSVRTKGVGPGSSKLQAPDKPPIRRIGRSTARTGVFVELRKRILVGERGFEPPTPWSRNKENKPRCWFFNPCEWCFNRVNSCNSCSVISVIFLWVPRNACPRPRAQRNSVSKAKRPLLPYEDRGKLQIQILCGADDNPRRRMNTARQGKRDPCFDLAFLNGMTTLAERATVGQYRSVLNNVRRHRLISIS
jgi:hypothetical protein